MDMCRQSVVFRDPAELAHCLRAINADPVLLRVKNRLDRAFDSACSAGRAPRPPWFPLEFWITNVGRAGVGRR